MVFSASLNFFMSFLSAEDCIPSIFFLSQVIKRFSCSAQLRLKFILLINVKMPTIVGTIVGILTFISRINYCLMEFMPEFSTDLGYFSIYDLLTFHAHLS